MDFTLILIAFLVFLMGVSLYSIIFLSDEDRAEIKAKQAAKSEAHAIKRDQGGVHWFWWLAWLIVFFPALIVVAIIHVGRKNRAAIRNAAQ